MDAVHTDADFIFGSAIQQLEDIYQLSINVFDCRCNVIRMGPLREGRSRGKKYVNIMVHSGHVYTFKKPQVATRSLTNQLKLFELSFDQLQCYKNPFVQSTYSLRPNVCRLVKGKMKEMDNTHVQMTGRSMTAALNSYKISSVQPNGLEVRGSHGVMDKFLEIAKDHLSTTEGPRLRVESKYVAGDEHKTRNSYMVFSDTQSFIVYASRCNEKVFHEILVENLPCSLFFDIEWYSASTNSSSGLAGFELYVTYLIQFLIACGAITTRQRNYFAHSIMDSSRHMKGVYKHSYHFIFPNVVFENPLTLRAFIQDYHSFIAKRNMIDTIIPIRDMNILNVVITEIIDTNVLRRRSCLRCALSPKNGVNPRLSIRDDFKSPAISSDFREDYFMVMRYNNFNNQVINSTVLQKPGHYLQQPSRACHPVSRDRQPQFTKYRHISLEEVQQILTDLGDTNSHVSLDSKTNQYVLHTNAFRVCPVGRVHYNQSARLYVTRENVITYFCFGRDCRRPIALGHITPVNAISTYLVHSNVIFPLNATEMMRKCMSPDPRVLHKNLQTYYSLNLTLWKNGRRILHIDDSPGIPIHIEMFNNGRDFRLYAGKEMTGRLTNRSAIHRKPTRNTNFKKYHMISADIETFSLTDHVFHPYAIGWMSWDVKSNSKKYEQLVVDGDTITPDNIFMEFLLRLTKMTIARRASNYFTNNYRPTVFFWNGSRFDFYAAIHSLLTSDLPERYSQIGNPNNLIRSNGRVISFDTNYLIFKDGCLLIPMSLRRAANAFGLESKKGIFPHRYLQNLPDMDTLYQRLYSTIKLSDIKSYISFYDDMKGKGVIDGIRISDTVQTQVRGISEQKWIETFSNSYEWYLLHADEKYPVIPRLSEYLKADVEVQWDVLTLFGDFISEYLSIDITRIHTISSLAMKVWKSKHISPSLPIYKVRKCAIFDILRSKCNRGGLTTPMSFFHYVKPEGYDIIKVDVTSLYPSACISNEFTEKYFTGFPNPIDGEFSSHTFRPTETMDVLRPALGGMFGFVEVAFDQSMLAMPVLVKRMKHEGVHTLTYVKYGTGWYSMPMICYAYDLGVRMRPLHMLYTYEGFNPLESYMTFCAQKKNEGDEMRASDDEMKKLKGQLIREVFKLLMNSLLGRLNMNPSRRQSILTRCGVELTNIMCNNIRYIDPQCNFVRTNDSKGNDLPGFFDVSFSEQDIATAQDYFEVAPYLSAYMLAYSKINMNNHFQRMTRDGFTLLYTDTDSIVAAAPISRCDTYIAERCRNGNMKTLGYMELEGRGYDEFLTIGPKKYGLLKGDVFEYKANGIPAIHNRSIDMYTTFLHLIRNPTSVGFGMYWNIKANNFQLMHAKDNTKKRLAFHCYKGRSDGKRLYWWNSEQEFKNYIDQIKTVTHTEQTPFTRS